MDTLAGEGLTCPNMVSLIIFQGQLYNYTIIMIDHDIVGIAYS